LTLGAAKPKQKAPVQRPALSSKWTGLSKHLLAEIYPVKPDGSPDPDGGPSVIAPPTDGMLEATANWSSPFENSGTETKAPAIMAMLQSGVLQSYSQSLAKVQGAGPVTNALAELARSAAISVTDASRAAQSRTGMTKLNSTQIFSGAPPVRMPMTLHFRAFRDPGREVRAPVDQLWAWFLAKMLATDGALVSAAKSVSSGQFLTALLPSEAPQMVGLRFGGFTFAPLVIESISQPITVPRTSKGGEIYTAVNIVLATLTALDAGDWRRARQGKPIALFNNQ
jgi:hypothetical protein